MRDHDSFETYEAEAYGELEALLSTGKPSRADMALAERALAGDAHGPDTRARMRWWLPAVVGAGLAAAVLLRLATTTPHTRAIEPTPAVAALTLSSGQVTIDGAGDKLASELTESALIEVGDGHACLHLDSIIDVCTSADTSFVLTKLGSSHCRIDLQHGRLVARLQEQTEGSSFTITAGDLSTTAVGTVFGVERTRGRRSARAMVLEGKVSVSSQRDRGAHVVVVDETAIDGSDGLEIAASDPQAVARAWEQMRAPDRSGPLGIVNIQTDPPGALVEIDHRRFGVSPLIATVAAGQHRVVVTPTEGTAIDEQVEVAPETTLCRTFRFAAPPETEAIEPEPDPEPKRARRAKRSKPRVSADELLARARSLAREGQHAGAARTYRELVRTHPRTQAAGVALVRLGTLQLRHLGDARAAARSYARYLKRPGSLEREARDGQIRALRKLGDQRAEARAIREFLSRYPNTAQARAHLDRLRALDPH